MERIYKKVIAIVCAIAMVVSTLSIQPNIVGAATELSDNTWATVGSWQLFTGTKWVGAAASYEGAGNSFGDMTLTITSPVNDPDTGDNKYGIQMGYTIGDMTLESGATYSYEMVINSTQAGYLFTQVPGVVQSSDISISVGDNPIKGTFTVGSYPDRGNIMIFPHKMPAGTVLKMVSLTVKKQTGEETSTTAAGEAEWKTIVGGEDLDATYSYDNTNKTVSDVVSIQKPAWATEKGIYMIAGAAISEVQVNGVTTEKRNIDGGGVIIWLSAFNEGNNEVVITHANGTSNVTIKKVSSEITETTTAETTTSATEDMDPSTITDWKAVTDSTTLSYYSVNNKVNVAKIDGTDLYIAHSLSATYQSVTLDGTLYAISSGAEVRIPTSSLTEGYHKLVVVNHEGTESDTVYIKVEKEAETTTPETTTPEPTTIPEIVDGTELLQDTEFEEGNVSHWNEYGPTKYTNKGNGQLDVEVPAYESGDYYGTQLVQNNLTLYEGKWYVAEVTITSDVDKCFQLIIQSDGLNGGDWTTFQDEIVSVAAGETKKVQFQFQAAKTTGANVLFGLMMGYVNKKSAAANVTIQDVSLKVYNSEQQISGSQTVLLTSNEVSISGFQMKTNFGDSESKDEIGFRSVCQAPNIGGSITVGQNTYTVARMGTLYTIEPDKNIEKGTSFTPSGMLLKSYDINNTDESYKNGMDTAAKTVNPYTLVVRATEEKGIMEKDSTYSTYVQTLIGTIGQLHPGNKIHVRAFVVTSGGTIIYSKKSVSTSIARVAAYMYQNSLSTNYRGHEYLYQKIVNVEKFVPDEESTNLFDKIANPYYRNKPLEYGWNENLYTPDDDNHMNLKPDVYLGSDYIRATTGNNVDQPSVNTNTIGGVISIAGVKYDYGISTNAEGYFEYNVPKNAKYFVGIVGIDDSVTTDENYVNGATITCEISFDGAIATTTDTLTYGKSEYIKVAVPQGASKIKIYFGDAGDGIGCDRASMANAGWMIDKSIEEETTYDMSKDPSDITRVYVFTDDSNATITKNAKTPGSITIISGEGDVNSVSDTGTIKLRGNSTALADKPAYNISFSSKQTVFTGAASGKKWCLLANAYDKSMLRNKLAMDLGKALGNVDTPETHYADFYLNGKLMGTYLISEPADNGRSGIQYDDTDDNELMFEWEAEKYESDQTYYATETLGIRFVVEDPEGLDTATTKYTNWVKTLKTFETALKDIPNNATNDTVLNYIDVDSFVDMYIVNELFKTVDFGYSSVKFYTKKDADGNTIIHAGCLWDFDLSSGNSSVEPCRTTEDFRCQTVNKWFGLLMQNTTFKNKVIEKYTAMQTRIQNIYQDNDLGTNQIDTLLSYIEKSKNRNYLSISEGGAGWSESKADSAEVNIYAYGYNTVSPYNTYTYSQHVNYLRTWLKNRNEWICTQWGISL